MPALIVVGDRTSHGGTVISGSPSSDIDGKLIARVGDRVACPKKGHGGVTTIISGDPTLIIDGSAAARHGDKTACGAMLISSQIGTIDDPGGGNATHELSSSAALIAAASGQVPTTEKYDLRFLVKDEATKRPLGNVPYRLTLETGLELTGVTDQQGLTKIISSDSAVIAKLEVPYYGNGSGDSYANDEHGACDC